jgi:hypothetical protein
MSSVMPASVDPFRLAPFCMAEYWTSFPTRASPQHTLD